MTACCKGKTPGTHRCPANGKSYASVDRKTVLHHVDQPWLNNITEPHYYFCSDPLCDVVYFAEDNSTITKDEVRTAIWQKSESDDAELCYCFGVSKSLALTDKSIKAFVIEQTKHSLCSCETSNPSGRCCLKDFPKQ